MGDEAPCVLVVSRDGPERAAAGWMLRELALGVRTAERLETLTATDLQAADAILLLPGRLAVPPDVALARVRTLAPGRAVILGCPEAAVSATCLAVLGPGTCTMPWPAGPSDLRRTIEGALERAAAGRVFESQAIPAASRTALHGATLVGGPDGHPAWFLDALLSACAPHVGGGAVLARGNGSWRVVVTLEMREAHVLRLVRRHPPPADLETVGVRHVRIGRSLRSPSAQLRSLRGWWWLAGPPCSGRDARTLLIQRRGAAEPSWLDPAMDVVARELRTSSPAGPDPVTGLERADADGLADRALSLATLRSAEEDGAGSAVVLLSFPGLREVRRAHGPRVEARLLAAAVGVLRRGLRPGDTVFRLSAEAVAVVVPAKGEADADRLAGRLGERLRGRDLARRMGEAGAGASSVDADVRALFVRRRDEPAQLAERLVRLGVPRA